MAGYVVKVIPQGTKTATPLDLSEKVLTFKFEDLEKAADKLTLTVDNFNLDNFDNPVWADGNLLRVTWGYDGRLAIERELVIKSVKGSTVLTVEAFAKSVLMNQEKRIRIFEHMKYSDIAKQMATEEGFPASAQQIDDSEVVWECVTQPGVTNAVFYRHLANKLHWQFFADFDGLHFHARRMGQRPLRKFTYYIDPTQSEIESFSIENDLTARPQGPTGAVQVKGRDPKNKKDIDATGNNESTKGRDTLGDVSKVVDRQTGTTNYTPNSVQTVVKSTTAPNAAAAQQKADNGYVQSQQRTVQLGFTSIGDPMLVAKSIIELEFPGVKRITGRYYVTQITHNLGAGQAYKIELKTRRDGTTAVGSGLGGAKETKTAGKANTQDPADGNGLEPSKKVDPTTGATSVIFSNTGGRTKK